CDVPTSAIFSVPFRHTVTTMRLKRTKNLTQSGYASHHLFLRHRLIVDLDHSALDGRRAVSGNSNRRRLPLDLAGAGQSRLHAVDLDALRCQFDGAVATFQRNPAHGFHRHGTVIDTGRLVALADRDLAIAPGYGQRITTFRDRGLSIIFYGLGLVVANVQGV